MASSTAEQREGLLQEVQIVLVCLDLIGVDALERLTVCGTTTRESFLDTGLHGHQVVQLLLVVSLLSSLDLGVEDG